MTDQYNDTRGLDRERFRFLVVKGESPPGAGIWCTYLVIKNFNHVTTFPEKLCQNQCLNNSVDALHFR